MLLTFPQLEGGELQVFDLSCVYSINKRNYNKYNTLIAIYYTWKSNKPEFLAAISANILNFIQIAIFTE